tara:strand:- start:70 stop:213 length:144 start_codon:yes stop_codon:yes gene_type:complete
MNDIQYRYLWDKVAEYLTELSLHDEVQYRVRATDESVTSKLERILND